MDKIIIASDSFKGSLTSSQVADAIREGVISVYPSAEIIRITVADGGEGTTDAVMECLGGKSVRLSVSDPSGRTIEAEYGLIDDGETAVIEVAAASGLTLLSQEERNPMLTSSYGTGEMIADALKRGCRRIMVGLGGSATNDGGLGMLSALGYRFYDSEGRILQGCGKSLKEVVYIDDSEAITKTDRAEFILISDVRNPFFGPEGAAHIFAPQKGADPSMTEELDKGLEHFSKIIHDYSGKDISNIPGAGAAGGLGGAFLGFLDGRIENGIEMILDLQHFDDLISDADMIITGEGKIDSQTVMGKVPYGVLKRAVNQGVPVIALCGQVERGLILDNMDFDAVIQITPDGMPLDMAMLPEIAKSNIITAVMTYLSDNQKIST